MKKRAMIAAILALVTACGPNPNWAAKYPQSEKARERYEAAVRRAEEIKHERVPKDYKAQIDAGFYEMLSDPDSRKIEYRPVTHGSVVCGAVNAKNQMGGYTGRKSFAAYFTPTGNLEYIIIYDSDKLYTMRRDPTRYHMDLMLYNTCFSRGGDLTNPLIFLGRACAAERNRKVA